MKNLTLLIKPVSSECNMNCSYCFYKDTVAKRAASNHEVMNFDVVEAMIKKAFDEDISSLLIGFQGGEPTLIELDYYLSVLACVQVYNTKNIPVDYSIQTNGLYLSDELLKFFKQERFLVGISLDGIKKTHNTYRLDYNNKGTFNRVMKTIKKLRQNEIDFNVLTVINDEVVKIPEKIYTFYKRNHLTYSQFIPYIPKDASNTESCLNPLEFGKFLTELFDLWYIDFKKNEYVSLRYFDNLIQIINHKKSDSCMFNGECQVMNIIEVDGCVYPCDFYANDNSEIGNVLIDTYSEMISSKNAIDFLSQDIHAKCLACDYYFICKGGCKRYRNEHGINCLCEGYEYFFNHSIEKLTEIAAFVNVNDFKTLEIDET